MSLSVDKLGDRAQAMTLAEAALKIFEAIESPYAEGARRQLDVWRGQAGPEWRRNFARLILGGRIAHLISLANSMQNGLSLK
jgi:hypothetical protein